MPLGDDDRADTLERPRHDGRPAPPPRAEPLDPKGGDGAGKRRFTVPITLALAGGIGSLVFIAVAAVLILVAGANRENTFELLSERSNLTLDLIESRLRDQLEPAETAIDGIGRLIDAGDLDLTDAAARDATFLAVLQTTPEVVAILLAETDGTMQGVGRTSEGLRSFVGVHNVPAHIRTTEMAPLLSDPHANTWGEVVLVREERTAAVNIRRLARDPAGTVIGSLIVAVTTRDLSRFVDELDIGVDTAVPFILYGDDRVLAHRALRRGVPPGQTPEDPLPGIDAIGDPILPLLAAGRSLAKQITGDVIAVEVESPAGEDVIAMTRPIDGYGPVPLTIGVYLPSSEVDQQLDRLAGSTAMGSAILVIAVLLGIRLGKSIGKPIRHLAADAASIAELEFGDVRPLSRSRFTELDEQARAFNRMLTGLVWLETYLPRTLVKRLLRKERGENVRSVEREVTVLFTDIQGFTASVEDLPAAETAALLNHHFGLLAASVESEGGTIDKFMGDGLMAFWNAPDRQKDHAERACRAALGIALAVQEDNRTRAAQGKRPLRLRIGIHTGAVVIGNIGAPGRMNYTIVGDAVNTCSRLETLGKSFAGDREVTVLMSADTADRIPSEFRAESIGPHAVRGRHAPVEVFRLD